MKVLLFSWFFCFCIFPAFAQGQQFSGVVNDIEDGSPLSGVFVDNGTRGSSAVTNAKGEFNIVAQPGDAICFSLVGYDSINISVPASINGAAFRRISMKRAVFILDEVQINSPLTPYQRDSISRRRTYARDLDWQKERSVMSPFSAIADNISRKSRMRWRFQRNFQKWEDEKYTATRYTPELVQSLTGLTGNICYQFMAAYPMDPDYARVATDLEIQMWIRYNYKNWIKKSREERVQVLPDSIPR